MLVTVYNQTIIAIKLNTQNTHESNTPRPNGTNWRLIDNLYPPAAGSNN